MVNEWCLNGSVNGKWYFNVRVCMVKCVSMVELYGQWCFNGATDGEWCFNGGVCMVNGVSMVELYGEWCFNGRVCKVNGVSLVVTLRKLNVPYTFNYNLLCDFAFF